ncbi:MAG: peptidylprolyl isomerase [Candidatus Nitrohelix vancouverensis]|uniref:Peptidyl-prolyl cis-trans isomerase n=1 Tax=Candidatus Nitrohelix vancouverensis TaxID=2705534 RepID=A0A7T0C1X7_9BACT|nr:MAG: peptidylprolyl isomerase [Candidatus Nitrohelix vancouverensis]
MSNDTAIIETTLGSIELEFFSDEAPGHVENFTKLARDGFYDGTAFHRVIPGFMIQGGDPNSKSDDRSRHGTGGPGYSIKAEFNDIPHERGILSMARSQDPDSAGSQFFIVVKDSNFLDGQYTAFGRVTKGMDVADKIVNSPRDSRDNPNERIEMKSVRIVSSEG